MSQQRSVFRYINNAGANILSESNEEKKKTLHVAQKKLQILVNVIRIYISWQKRKSLEAGSSNFLSSWAALATFCELQTDDTPSLTLVCPMMYEIRLEAMTCTPQGHTSLPKVLNRQPLQTQFIDQGNTKTICELQVKYMSDAILHFLTAARSSADCRSGLLCGLGKAYAGDALEGLEAAVAEDLHDFMLIIGQGQSTTTSTGRKLGDVLQLMPKAAPAHNAAVTRPYFLPLLLSYPQFD